MAKVCKKCVVNFLIRRYSPDHKGCTAFSSQIYSRKQRAKRACLHAHSATAARVKDPVAYSGVFDLGMSSTTLNPPYSL